MAGGGGENDLNLVPYMDVLLNLIIYMIVATKDVGSLLEVPVVLPQTGGGNGGKGAPVELVHMTARLTSDKVYFFSSDKMQSREFTIEQGAEIGAWLQKAASTPNMKPQLVMSAEVGVPMGRVVSLMDMAQNPAFRPASVSVPEGADPKEFECEGLKPDQLAAKAGPFCNVSFNPPGKRSNPPLKGGAP